MQSAAGGSSCSPQVQSAGALKCSQVRSGAVSRCSQVQGRCTQLHAPDIVRSNTRRWTAHLCPHTRRHYMHPCSDSRATVLSTFPGPVAPGGATSGPCMYNGNWGRSRCPSAPEPRAAAACAHARACAWQRSRGAEREKNRPPATAACTATSDTRTFGSCVNIANAQPDLHPHTTTQLSTLSTCHAHTLQHPTAR